MCTHDCHRTIYESGGLKYNSRHIEDPCTRYLVTKMNLVRAARRYATQEKADLTAVTLQSLKDVGLMFSANDDAVQPIDTEPIFENPQLFSTLSMLHQGQVLRELQGKFDRKWTKLTTRDKKLGYYIAYGNWGSREAFAEWNTQAPPPDLPFLPSSARSFPNPSETVKKCTAVKLSETPIRKAQFDTSKVDGVTKFFIYATIFVVLFALARDKNIGEAGKPIVEEIKAKEAEKLPEPKHKKWFYLWLK